MTSEADVSWMFKLKADFPEFEIKNIECGPGWEGLVRELLERWRNACKNAGDITVESIHQDHGELRSYYKTVEAIEGAAEDAYDNAQTKSHVTCELTGKPGLLVKRDGVRIVRAYDLLKNGDVISDSN